MTPSILSSGCGRLIVGSGRRIFTCPAQRTRSRTYASIQTAAESTQQNEDSLVPAVGLPAQTSREKSLDSKDWIFGTRRPKKPTPFSYTRNKPLTTPPPPRSTRSFCRTPLRTINAAITADLDPQGFRTNLFSRDNQESIKVRDIVLVRQRDGDPFAGVVMKIKRSAQASSILVRNTVTGVGVEREFKIYSPRVTGIELVQRRVRPPKQFSLYYLRKPEHDVGSVDKLVRQYLKTRSAMEGGKIILNAMQPDVKKGSRKKR